MHPAPDDPPLTARAESTNEDRHREKARIFARMLASRVGPIRPADLAKLEAADDASLDLWTERLNELRASEARELANGLEPSVRQFRAREGLENARFTQAELLLRYILQTQSFEVAQLGEFVDKFPPEVNAAMRSTADKLREQGREEGHRSGMAAVLERLLTIRFGPLDAMEHARLQVADEASLERWADRLLTAASKAAVFD